jgi:Flp pilus assembly protein TadB
MRSMWWLRFVIIGLGATLGVVLLLSGNPLVGALILALAATRLVMVLGMRRRRRAMMQRWQARNSPGPWSSTSTG